MPQQNRKNLVRRHKVAVAVDGADAIGVAVQRESRIVLSCSHRLAQGFHVRLDRFGVHAAEKGIARAANLVRLDPMPVKQFAQQSAPGAVHRIDYKAEFRRAQPVPIDQLVDASPDTASRISSE